MPDDALPQPWPTKPRDVVYLERTYRDVLGRPMEGSVRISGVQRVALGELVIPPAAVTAQLEDGRLSVMLPPGQYSLVATLVTADREKVKETETVWLSAPAAG